MMFGFTLATCIWDWYRYAVQWPWEEWHGQSMAWAWHGKCESDMAALCKSNGKHTF